MKLSEHADHTEKTCGIRAEDIHKWIDGYFDRQSFENFIEYGRTEGYNPYSHRQFRHCREALPEALKEFSNKYSRKDIECVFNAHLKDDYGGYMPTREDFADGRFREKYHESGPENETILTKSELEKYFRGQRYRKESELKKKRLPNRFGFRIAFPAAAAAALFIAAVFIFILPIFHDSLMKEKEEMLEEISSVALSILDYYGELESSGEMNRADAQQASIDEIGKLRYGPENDNYFWITDMQPVMIMHPWRPDLIGSDLSNYKDSMNRSGKLLFVESVKLVKESGGGFLQYMWQLDESGSRTVPKLSRVEGFSRWEWIIGTGVYVNDVEEEISRLTRQLVVILLSISGLLAIFLIYLTLQSLSIERSRRQAESGLIEAKDRYRALVEASNEGYLLVLNGLNVFSNPVFRRMTGYSEEEITETGFMDMLFPDPETGLRIRRIIEGGDSSGSDEFEAVIKCRSGARLEVIINGSKIFLTEENGIVLSFRPLHLQRNAGSPIFSADTTRTDPFILFGQIENSSNSAQAVRVLNQLPLAVRSLIMNESPSQDVRNFISEVYKKGLIKLALFAESELGPPPCEYTFLSLGSSGRGELTLFSDQDNALVFSDISGQTETDKTRLYFLNLSDRICGLLNQSGFPYCPGGIMAVNPAWCLSLDEWKERYAEWFRQADNISLLDLHVFFDITNGWGSADLVDIIYEYIFSEIRNRPEFLIHFARNCLGYKAPQGLLGNIRTEVRDGVQVLNLKETLIPLINFARISALRDGIRTASTLGRLEELSRLGSIDAAALARMSDAFEKLWRLRFSNQIFAHGELRKVNDDLNPSDLDEHSLADLKECISAIAGVQSRLSYDFLGIDLS